VNSTEQKGRTASVPPGSWLTIVFTVWVLLMLWASVGLSSASAWIPRLVLSTALICLLLQLVNEFRAARTLMPQTQVLMTDGRGGRSVAAIAWLALLLLLTWLLGVALASALFCLAWLRWHAGEYWLASLIISASLGLALWLIFSVLLGAGLYSGVLWSSVS